MIADIAVAFSRPAWQVRVSTRDDEHWARVPSPIKAFHMVGRTVPNLRSLLRAEDVATLCDTLMFDAYPPGWGSMGVAQQLDIVATEFIRVREPVEHRYKQGSAEHAPLSLDKWWRRVAAREFPMEHAALDALLAFSPRVRRLW